MATNAIAQTVPTVAPTPTTNPTTGYITLPPFEQLTPNLNRGRVSPLRQGQPATFDGVLFDTTAAAVVATERDFNHRQCEVFVNREVSLVRNQAVLDTANLNARVEALTSEQRVLSESRVREIERLTNALSASEERSNSFINSKGMFWFGLGIVLTAAVATGIYLGVTLSP